MCRILVLLEQNPEYHALFLNQATTRKRTPFLDFEYDNDYHLDGSGWVFVTEDRQIKIEKFLYPHLPSHPPNTSILLIAHLRNQGRNCIGTKTIHNIHPFVFENHVFCHNGVIHEFWKNRQHFPEVSVLGETDSEHILHILINMMQKKGYTMKETVIDFFGICIEQTIPIIANFVWYYHDEMIITRFSNIYGGCCSLYVQPNIISSEPIVSPFSVFPENTISYFQYVDKKWSSPIYFKINGSF